MHRVRAARRRAPWLAGAIAAASLLGAVPAQADIWPTSHARVAEALERGEVADRRAAAAKLTSLPPALGRQLAEKALGDADVDVRLLAARAAAVLGVERAGDVVVAWLQERDARLRVAAAEVIEASPTPNAVQALARVLGDVEPDVRRAAAAAMGGSGLAEAVSPLLGHLDDAAPEVRLEVVRALGRIGDARAVVPLVSKLQDAEEEVRREAARALGRLGDPRATTTLVLALQDRSLTVRVQALRALGDLRAGEATAAIAALVTGRGGDRAEGALRDAALEALGRIASAIAIDVLTSELEGEGPVSLEERAPVRRALALAGDPAAAALIRALRGSLSRRMASSAVLALGAIGRSTPGAANARMAIEQAARSGAASLEAGLMALGALGEPSALPFLLEHLDDPDGRARRTAVEVATRLLDPEQRDGRAVDVVQARGADPTAPVGERLGLTRLLGRTGSPRAVPLLADLAAREGSAARSTPLRRAALEALGTLGTGSPKSDATLLAALDDDDPSLRATAAKALGRVGSERAAKELLRRLSESAEQDRAALGVAVSGALARGQDDALVGEVERRLAAAPGGARDALLEGLGRMPVPAAGAALARLRKSPDADDRRKVAEALAHHPQQGAALLALATDPDPTVRANAVWSLGSAGDAAAVGPLTRALADLDVAVAGNAAVALARVATRQGRPEPATKSLCDGLADHRAYVRASSLSGLRIVGARCDGQEIALLLRDRSWRVRDAAARLLHAVAPDDADVRRALWRCAVEDRDASVAKICEVAPPAVKGSDDVLVYVVPHGATTPTARAPFALVLPDGTMRLGVADRRGAVFARAAPAGVLSLAVPAALAGHRSP